MNKVPGACTEDNVVVVTGKVAEVTTGGILDLLSSRAIGGE